MPSSAQAPESTTPSLRPRRRRASVIGVLGELLLTAGVLILLFLAWQLWWNDAITAGAQSNAASSQSVQWMRQAPAQSDAPAPADYGEPAVHQEAFAAGETFAVMYVPRFGENSQRNIAEGIETGVLNSTRLGIGHYPGTAMPGAVGNFAIASHRSAYGGGMHEIEQLQLGDWIYIQTVDGWYSYRFRNLEYVKPDGVGVLAPVPGRVDATATDRIVTLTSCNPLLSTAERIIAYGVLDSWRPAMAGPPPEIAAAVAGWKG